MTTDRTEIDCPRCNGDWSRDMDENGYPCICYYCCNGTVKCYEDDIGMSPRNDTKPAALVDSATQSGKNYMWGRDIQQLIGMEKVFSRDGAVGEDANIQYDQYDPSGRPSGWPFGE